ncbi:MAG: LolA family protein [Chloroflexota bacterium]
MSRKTLMSLIGLVSLVVLTAGGCAQKPTAEEIVAQMQKVVASTNDAHAIVEATANVQGESVRVVAEVWQQQPNKGRVEVLETDRPEFEGLVSVSDGQTVWFYTPANNSVTIAAVGEEAMDLQVFIEDMDGVIRQVLDQSAVELLGEEKIAGVETHKLSLQPKEGEENRWPVTGTATLWVDQERWVVLKAHVVAPNIGEGTLEVTSFELNPGLDEAIFAFEAPAGVEVVQVDAEQPQHLTLDEAQAQADFDLLLPTYPSEGATLVDVLAVKGAFLLVYDWNGVSFTVAQSSKRLPPGPLGVSEEVAVRGVQAELVIDQVTSSGFLSWQEAGRYFYVLGRVEKEELVTIAESLE